MISSNNTSAIAAFCRELREAREFQLVTLEDVARMSRITIEFLEALERGQWDQIPPAYIRGYLGSYAQTVGMNRDKVLRTYDQLMLPSAVRGNAVLDEAPPLLSQPTDVGVTRAKIRASWFAALSRNRKVFYPLTFLALLLLMGLLNFSHQVRDDTTKLIPFSEAIAENREQVHSPFTQIPLPDSILIYAPSKSSSKWMRWIGSTRGSLTFQRDTEQPITLRFGEYDTINIQYLAEYSAKLHPASSAETFRDSTRLKSTTILPGDTAFFHTTTGQPIALDTAQIVSDSL
jgi:hypothetical protein